jgi:hypothetical protein
MKRHNRFEISFDETYRDIDAEVRVQGGDNLQELLRRAAAAGANPHAHIVHEYDLGDIDPYGVPESIAWARIVGVEPEDTDLSYFVTY